MRTATTSKTIPLLFSLALGCGPAEPESKPESDSPTEAPTPPAPAQPPVGAFVVLDPSAMLATAASADAARIPIASEKTPEVGRIAEVVGVVGDFIEVRTVPPERGQACAGRLGSEADIELRFFVERSALLQVLTAPKRVEFDDGTKLEFAAGVPVIEVGENGQLATGHARLFMPLAAEDVGLWFSATLAGEPFKEQADGVRTHLFHYGKRNIDPVPPFLNAETLEDIEGGTRNTFVNACGSFTFRVDFSQTLSKETFAANMAEREAKIASLAAELGKDPSDCEIQQWVAAAGTSASWKQSGTSAGTTLREYVVPEGAVESEGKVCFRASGFDLCIESTKLERRDNLACLAGGLGLVGIGGANGGFADSGSGGAGFGGRGKAVAGVKQGKATVSAGLDADIIRRIVRAHINEIRSCYNKELAASPTLAGTVEVAFAIDGKGKVPSSSVKQSTLAPANDAVGTCIVKATKRWTFPKPIGGATVDVIYPFILDPG